MEELNLIFVLKELQYGQQMIQVANIYYSTSGTSMACPAVSGTLALLHEAYRDLNSGSNANSGLLKCLLLNTADDIGNPGPDFTHGYGEVNAFKAIKALEQGRYFLHQSVKEDLIFIIFMFLQE